MVSQKRRNYLKFTDVLYSILLADVYVGFEFVQLFVRQLSRNGLSIVSSIKLDAKYIHTCSCIIKLYAIYISHAMGASIKHLVQIMQYYDSSDCSSSKH